MKMPKPIDAPKGLTLRDSKPILLRAGTGLAIAAGFLWVTSQVDPQPSSAISNQSMMSADQSPLIANQSSSGADARHLGVLEGKNYWVRLEAAGGEPRYSVIDHLGNVVASGLTKSEMYMEFPELKLETMTAGPLMMATDKD